MLAVLAGYPLWVQFFGPLHQAGSPFTTDFFKNDLSGFVVPSSFMLFHTAGSAAAALRYQGQLPEYLGYLGWPLIAVLVAGTIRFWRRLPVRACAVACAVLSVFSLGGTLLASGHEHAWIKLPWYWLQGLPVLSAALPDRFSIVADGAAAALLAFCVDAAVPALAAFALSSPGRRLPRLASGRGWAAWPAAVVMSCAVLAVLPIVPRPLPAVAANPVPPGWSAAFAALHLPASATVLAVPVPMSTFTEPLRWQADTGQPAALVGGYFMGPAWNGHAYTDGNGLPQAGRYLNLPVDRVRGRAAHVADRRRAGQRAPRVAQLRADQGGGRQADAGADRRLARDGRGRGDGQELSPRRLPHRPARAARRRDRRRHGLAHLNALSVPLRGSS